MLDDLRTEAEWLRVLTEVCARAYPGIDQNLGAYSWGLARRLAAGLSERGYAVRCEPRGFYVLRPPIGHLYYRR